MRLFQKKKKILITIVGFLILMSNVPMVVAENDETSKYISSESEVLLKKDYWAVLIGLGNYPSSHDLPYSVNEILSFKDTLLQGGNWNDTHIQVLTDNQANKSAIFDAISWLGSNTDKDDISLFYFAGHGIRTSNNEYILAYDESISDVELNDKLDEIESQVVVIIDSCFSGGFIEETGKRGRVILTACKKDEETYQVRNLSSGIFGYFLNASLEYLTRNVETTFLFTWFLSVYYSNHLSKEFNGDYTIHPQMYDGNLKLTRIINRHHYMHKFFYELFTNPIKHDNLEIWKM